MRVLICGGRDFNDWAYICSHLNQFDQYTPISTVISGGARGADGMAELWAMLADVESIVEEADWATHGKAAGRIRNQKMLDLHHPGFVIAFPGGPGTAHMVEIAKKAKIPVIQYHSILFSKEDEKYGFLSNFATGFGFKDDQGAEWSTSEHYYQAAKAVDPDDREWIRQSPTPAAAKKRGQIIEVVPGWQPVHPIPFGGEKEVAMRAALQFKFSEGSNAADLLMETHPHYLIEYAPWGDTYWGIDKDKKGMNRLGKMLMARRDELIAARLESE